MSYPPRPPMGMGMMPPGYNYPPMGMMPMGMPMVPPGMPPSGPPQKPSKKLVPQEISKDDKEKPPVTTVFVGNISERAPDPMIRQMLNRCGNVISWKRVQGASGKLQAFGFCEFEAPEATLRCIRLLNDWSITNKKLVVKVDAKTKAQLEEWKEKKQAKNGAEDLGEDVNEFAQREDRVAKAGLDAIMREYSNDLNKLLPNEQVKEEVPPPVEKKKIINADIIKDEGLDDIGLEEEKKEIINREIGRFRDLHKDEDEEAADKDASKRRQERERERERRRLRELQEQEKERLREKREREKEREKRRRSRTKSRTRSRSRSRDRSDRGDRERESRNKPEKPKREREKKMEDEEDAYERRKLDRKLREKEIAYQERLKNWEARERKRARDADKEKEKEEDRQKEEVKEARRLKEFLEDYDDERDDPKYYKGSQLQRRLKEREKEIEADLRDRQREREELEEIKRKLVDEGHPDPEAELAKIEREREEHMKPKPKIVEEIQIIDDSPEPAANEEEEYEVEVKRPLNMHPSLRPVDMAPSVSSRSQSPSSGRESPEGIIIPEPAKSDSQPATVPVSSSKSGFGESPSDSRDSLGSSKETSKRKKLTVGNVFNQDDDEGDGPKRRKLVPLDYSEDEKAMLALSKPPVTVEEKRKHIKNLIERIPTAKEALFAFTLDWTMVDTILMDRRIKPWVNKKIVEYIGEEEPTLTEFVCQKVMAHSTPEAILGDVAMVLDEEAEVFVVKMWRLLIYETEAKKMGLVK